MQVPTMKTLLTYTKGEEVKKVVVDFFDKEMESYEIERAIEIDCPFSFKEELYVTLSYTTAEIYTVDKNFKRVTEVTVTISSVLEFDGRYFIGLEELLEVDKIEN
ncbi:hypothetical protein M5X17_31175 [Paenibacillus alvei]|uniref:hypothetical protein n=1 Tax=Paenibacillus alvei TaxID=44250 RepID=UPI0022822DBC|nr:hypothetical protein [Paenibacillus alvei]MCY9738156.1 hypothetical protein [Paenibacillus alvei]